MRIIFLISILFALTSHAQSSGCEEIATDITKKIFTYDTDGNHLISAKEAVKAFNDFDAGKFEVLLGAPKMVRRAVFTYFFKYQRTPSAYELELWLYKRLFWKFERDEEQVLNSVKMLISCSG